MNRAVRWTLGVAMLGMGLSAAGCAVETRAPQADLTLTWTFEGQPCQPAGVATVGIVLYGVGGQVVANDSIACAQNGTTYRGLTPDNYSLIITGSSPGGARLYQTQVPVAVDEGANQVDVNLPLAQ